MSLGVIVCMCVFGCTPCLGAQVRTHLGGRGCRAPGAGDYPGLQINITSAPHQSTAFIPLRARTQEAEAAARLELEAIMGDSNQSENARRRAKEALRKQAEEMAALNAQVRVLT